MARPQLAAYPVKFPTLEQVCTWLYRIGFIVESVHGGYHGEAFDKDHRRAVLWARKIVL